ncbi:MAG: hypothetical protein LJE89_06790 [Deltaproteobacteria bacterium]|nr:hypothetical protein [Deltaproteobacteria bacterium]
MNKSIFSLILLLGLTGGLAGGILASHFFVTAPVLAAKTSEPQNIVAAEEFRLLDKEGRILSTWGMYAGGPGIVLFNKNGQFRAVFSLTSPEEGPVLTFADKDGVHRATVGLGVKRQPYLTLRDQAGKERISLSLDVDGDPYLVLYDEKENERAVLGTMELTKIRRTGAIKKGSISSFVLLGADGEVTWKAP